MIIPILQDCAQVPSPVGMLNFEQVDDRDAQMRVLPSDHAVKDENAKQVLNQYRLRLRFGILVHELFDLGNQVWDAERFRHNIVLVHRQ